MQKGDLITEKQNDYELIDSGEGEKLEKFGSIVLRRPEAQAIWSKSLGENVWAAADAVFSRTGAAGAWKINTIENPERLSVDISGLAFNLKLLPSKHTGVFPEQSSHWSWLEEKISKHVEKGRNIEVLNLFAYTGGATMACLRAGAAVCHVDASKFAVDLTDKNLKLNNLREKPVRLIVDDVRKFVEREIKRGKKYDIVLLDPPVYGKGVKNEVWKIEEDLAPFLKKIKKILSPNPVAVILNGYSSVYSHKTYLQVLGGALEGIEGGLSSGELFIKQSESNKLLPSGIYARFEN
ncbi:MAG: class I SAM-dependent methyltransferase [Patescibacteria group bacterium]